VYWPDVTAVVALAVLTAAYFWTLIFTNDYTVLAFPDDSIQSFTWYQYLSRALGQGVFPLWDPYTLSGHSFIGEIQTGVFYPPNLILALASAGLPISSVQIESLLIIHVFMASLFTYALARYLGLGVLPSLVSGVAFAFGGVVIDRIQAQTNIFLGLVWLPLALLCLEAGINKRSVALSAGSGLSLALALLAGHIEPPYHIAIALVSLTAWHIIQDTGPKRFWAILCGLVALVTGGLASAVQILPSIEYAPLSMRALGGADLVASNARVPTHLSP